MYSRFAARSTLERVAQPQNWTSALWETCPAVLSPNPPPLFPSKPSSCSAHAHFLQNRCRGSGQVIWLPPRRQPRVRQPSAPAQTPPRLSVTMAACAGGPGKCGGFSGRLLPLSLFCYWSCKCQCLRVWSVQVVADFTEAGVSISVWQR